MYPRSAGSHDQMISTFSKKFIRKLRRWRKSSVLYCCSALEENVRRFEWRILEVVVELFCLISRHNRLSPGMISGMFVSFALPQSWKHNGYCLGRTRLPYRLPNFYLNIICCFYSFILHSSKRTSHGSPIVHSAKIRWWFVLFSVLSIFY